MSNAINWFEIPVTDFDRAVKFYSALYQAELPLHGMGELEMAFIPYEQGKGVGGTLVAGEGYEPSSNGVKIYLNAGDDLTAMQDRVDSAGGKVLTTKKEIAPGVGFFAEIQDSEGNLIYLHSMN